ncbi:MAG TPA: hypothetical protein VF407_08355 [Polyangiaceae bacterium]
MVAHAVEGAEDADAEVVADFGDDRTISYFLNVSFSRFVVRAFGAFFPAFAVALSGSYLAGLVVALLGGAFFGSARAATNAKKLGVSARGLEVLATDGTASIVAWNEVTAVECWRWLGGRTELSVHVVSQGATRVVRLGSIESARSLKAFFAACASRTPFREGRIGPLAAVGDASVRSPLVHAFVVDAVVGALAAAAAGLYAHASLLAMAFGSALVGVVSAGTSAGAIVVARFRLRRATFVRTTNGWNEEHEGTTSARTTLPGPLRAWSEAMLFHHAGEPAPKPYR